MRAVTRESTRESYHERILRVLDHIQTHLDEELTLPGLARVARFSPFHFHHVFRGMVGEGLAAYIRQLRLERSWRRLVETEDPVTAIALAAGYGSHEAFDHAFKAHFGLTPTDARMAASITARLGPEDGRLPEPIAARLARLLAGEEHPSPFGVEVRRIDPIPVAAMRQTGPYSEIPALFGRLVSWAGRSGLLGPEARILGLCHDDPEMTPSGECRYDACIALPPGKAPTGNGVRQILIQGGEYAVAIHRGRHCDLPTTYSVICGQWCPVAGREIRDVPAIENFIDDARKVPEADLRTEIYVPLEEEAH